MRKVQNVIFCLLFFALLALPAVLMPFLKEAENTEKRELAAFPELITEGEVNGNFAEEFGTWLQEHVGLRSLLVAQNSTVKATLFGQSSESSILVGKDGWLYYADTLPDYLQVVTVSSRNLRNVAHTLRLFADYAAAQGSDFVVALIPNKNTIYPASMPYYYLPLAGGSTNRKELNALLAAAGVKTAALEKSLRAAGGTVYQKQDSHWTYAGALLGYDAILSQTTLPHKQFENLRFTARQDWDADLAEALYAASAEKDVQQYPDYSFSYEITSHETAVNALTLTTWSAGGQGSLVMYRDSFANTMQVYFAESFEEAYFSRTVPYRGSLIASQNADLTVLEITERNIPNLAAAAPVFEAPSVALDQTALQVNAGVFTLRQESAGGGLVHLYGTIDERLLDTEYRVYLMVGKADAAAVYEACPIFETELLGASAQGDNGYSLYLPAEKLEGKPLSLLVESKGFLYIGSLQ